jgi:uncharacterized zinc-type alcohol dehydrogenase-like protein
MINAYAAQSANAALTEYQFDPGELKPEEVEIEVMYCGICHSDLSMIDNEWGQSKYPLVPGHGVVGKISQVGSQVKHLKSGQHVGLGWHSSYCNQCDYCDEGDHNLCSKAKGTIRGHHGGFADKVRADGNSVVAIPDGINLEKAGPLFCGGITVFTPLIEYDIKPTDKVAVIGIGGLGHMALKFLNAWGCQVTAFTSSEAKKTEALELGAHFTLDSKDPDVIASAARKFDLIISTVNVKLDWNLYLNTLKPRGRLHFVGATIEPLDVSIFALMGAQRSISSSPVGSPATIKKMLEFAKLHNIEPQIESFAFDQINAAIDHLRKGKGKANYRVVLKR